MIYSNGAIRARGPTGPQGLATLDTGLEETSETGAGEVLTADDKCNVRCCIDDMDEAASDISKVTKMGIVVTEVQ